MKKKQITPNPARKAFLRWKEKEGLTYSELCPKVKDHGQQLQQWAGGHRDSLPLTMKMQVSVLTGIPIRKLLDRNELQSAKLLVALMAES